MNLSYKDKYSKISNKHNAILYKNHTFLKCYPYNSCHSTNFWGFFHEKNFNIIFL